MLDKNSIKLFKYPIRNLKFENYILYLDLFIISHKMKS